MKFVDANVLLYAILRPKRKLTEREMEIKEAAKRILERINDGEEVLTSVVHLSEVAKVLEDVAGLAFSISFLKDLMLKKNVVVEDVDRNEYFESILLAGEKGIGINDALAYVIMRRKGIEEIYTFDKHFRNLDVHVSV
ncbi:VapC toxin family PIN domain ribonuclease [Archaeoglobales archaeon]|nr:MAG: VapC toxin family PIN domain ribonuclease [Archaeoglobales archaeon]